MIENLINLTLFTVATRKPPIVDQAKPAVDAAANQARLEEADTFRGVHLDPNAHHWDEVGLTFAYRLSKFNGI